jgi:ribosomal 50S subunit-recycling heat shock protein
MRLDVFLKHSRLASRRALAQEMCDAGAVTVNGRQSKSSHEVREGDLISVRGRGRETTVCVIAIPSRPPSKREAASLYEIVKVETYNID